MALPTIARTWQFRVNQVHVGQGTTLAQSRALMRSLKDSLKVSGSWTNGANGAITPTGGWTVIGSSDGSTAAMDGVDRWAADSNLVWNGTTRSWIVLQQTGIAAKLQVCIDLNSGTDTNASVLVSGTGFGAANGGTDGSITARPTALNSVTYLSAAAWGSPGATTTQSILHVMLTADGKSTVILVCRNNKLVAFWNFTLPDQPRSGWTNPPDWNSCTPMLTIVFAEASRLFQVSSRGKRMRRGAIK